MGESMASANRIAAAERQARALELRKAGRGYATIARALGYAGPSGAYKVIATALRALTREPTEELRALELARLDDLLTGLWAEARAGNVSKVDRVLKIIARRSALLGLDAPATFKDLSDPREEAKQIAAEIGKPELVEQIARDLVLGQEAARR